MKLALDLGCGLLREEKEGFLYFGLDLHKLKTVDIVNDLNTNKLPFKDNSFDEIKCFNIMEHVSDFLKIMEEIHRIGKPGALVRILVPHFSSMGAFQDPTHVRFFGSMSLDSILTRPSQLAHYSKSKFEFGKFKIGFWKFPQIGNRCPQKWIGAEWLANSHPIFYERLFAFIFPAEEIYYEIYVAK